MKEAVNEEHEGKRKAELTWKINRIHWEKNRFIYDLMYQRKVLSRELVSSHRMRWGNAMTEYSVSIRGFTASFRSTAAWVNRCAVGKAISCASNIGLETGADEQLALPVLLPPSCSCSAATQAANLWAANTAGTLLGAPDVRPACCAWQSSGILTAALCLPVAQHGSTMHSMAAASAGHVDYLMQVAEPLWAECSLPQRMPC